MLVVGGKGGHRQRTVGIYMALPDIVVFCRFAKCFTEWAELLEDWNMHKLFLDPPWHLARAWHRAGSQQMFTQ